MTVPSTVPTNPAAATFPIVLADLRASDTREASALIARPSRVSIARVPVDRMTMNEAVQCVVQGMSQSVPAAPLLIMGPNAQLVSLAAKNRRFARALRAAYLNVPDGISVVLASRLLGSPIPERVTGGDLMEQLCREAARSGFSVFFLGGLPGAAVGAAAELRRRYPALRVAGCYCPKPGFEDDPAESAAVRRAVSDAAPDLLCVAFGAPRQEIWMQGNCPTLPVRAAIAVGAALDTMTGLRRRAPRWTHRFGIEWLYRLVREPRRLWRRYLFGNTIFILLVGRQILRRFAASLREPLPAGSFERTSHPAKPQ